jgi:RNA polymerase sigma-70 factor, ECF subfamily
MGLAVNSEPNDLLSLLNRAMSGEEAARAELFARHRDRLRLMVRLRLDRRLQGRVDPSDVLQDAFLDFGKRLPEFDPGAGLPFYLWLRGITGQRLVDLQRTHLGTQMRDAAREVSLHRGMMPQASSVSLAAQLLGRMTTASHAAIRAELQLRVQDALNTMDATDREVLTLRHFEQMSNEEAAKVLDLTKSAASKRYIRALRRLKDILATLPGFGDFSNG